MRVSEHISSAEKPFASFEILPPMKGKGINRLFDIIDPLMEFKPPFINVTYHRAEYKYKKRSDGLLEKIEVRKRPGTVGICSAIMNRYHVDAVPHLTCGGFTIQETEDALIDLNYLGIDNVLILRGDPAKNESQFIAEENGHKYAIDFVKQVKSLNAGRFLEEENESDFSTNFNIGVAGYPEKHYEAPNFETDIQFLKQKVQAGADYIVTQLFYDNEHYFRFVKSCRDAGINVPIIPGIKPLTTKSQINMIPRVFSVEIPNDLSKAVESAADNKAVKEIGVEWAVQQSKALLEYGVPCIHYYTMSRPGSALDIVRKVF